MKTSIDIPTETLREAIRHSKARTKREAVLTAIEFYNQRQRMAVLTRHLGTCDRLITPEELNRMREGD